VLKSSSDVSSGSPDSSESESQARIEIGYNTIRPGSTVVVVLDVLATGNTLCDVLRLLNKARIP
jgi:adenine/guanine phosphoribosyltransferase-like PRPP-binding protein